MTRRLNRNHSRLMKEVLEGPADAGPARSRCVRILIATRGEAHYNGLKFGGMSELPTVAHDVTADELVHLRLPNKRTELVRGRLVVREPAGYRHGVVAAKIARLISIHVHDHDLGIVVAAETGFKLFADPDTVRAPDAAFLSRGRAPNPPPAGFLDIAPDLVVEVVSPNDRAGEVQGKVGDWLNAGSRLVWVVDPGRRRAVVYRANGTLDLLGERDAIDGEDVLPGFSHSLADVW